MMKQATQKEIREYFKRQNMQVRISRDGEVQFRAYDYSQWRGGRWIDEYKMTDVGVIHI